MKAVFLDRGSFPSYVDINLPPQVTDVVEYDNTSADQVAERIQNAQIVLTNKVVITQNVIENAPHVKLIQVMATGINHIDLKACKENNVTVQNVEGYSTVSVPEHTFSTLLALRRNLFSYINDVKAGKWANAEYFCFLDYPIHDLSETTMTIIGSGSLGKKVAEIAQAFGMKTIFAERKGSSTIRDGYQEFEQALQSADVVSVHCPLTNDTTNLISSKELSLMKSSALLLNMSRGGIVDEVALLSAFEHGKIAGAAFDVATVEPMPLDHPLNKLSGYHNFLLTPHVAWASDGAMKKLVSIAMDKIHSFLVNHT